VIGWDDPRMPTPAGPKGALLEPSLAKMPVREAVQLERQGYFCPDSTSRSAPLVFNRTIALRDTWTKLQVGG